MHWCIIFVSSSFSSVLEQFINACDLSSKLIIEVVSLSILEDVLSVKELLINKAWSKIARTNNKNLGRCES
jgi:hypothetical protein